MATAKNEIVNNKNKSQRIYDSVRQFTANTNSITALLWCRISGERASLARERAQFAEQRAQYADERRRTGEPGHHRRVRKALRPIRPALFACLLALFGLASSYCPCRLSSYCSPACHY